MTRLAGYTLLWFALVAVAFLATRLDGVDGDLGMALAMLYGSSASIATGIVAAVRA